MGYTISELLDLKKENVHLEEQYFNVIVSKTDNVIRKVPIADKVLPHSIKNGTNRIQIVNICFIQKLESTLSIGIIMTVHPLMEQLKIDRTPHCCRHTCISLLAEAS